MTDEVRALKQTGILLAKEKRITAATLQLAGRPDSQRDIFIIFIGELEATRR